MTLHISLLFILISHLLTPFEERNIVGADPVTLEEAISMAPSSGKKILIDVYVEWCPYCQRMHANTYSNEEVLHTISEHFLWVRINAESNEMVNYHGTELTMANFARALENRSYPTTYFMNEDGNIIGVQPGYFEADVFTELLRFVGTDAFLRMDFESFQDL